MLSDVAAGPEGDPAGTRTEENETACEPAPAPAPQPAPAAGETPARTAGDIPNTAAEATGVETAQEPAPAPEPAAVGTPEANTSAPMTNADAVKALERLGVTASKPGDGRMFTEFGVPVWFDGCRRCVGPTASWRSWLWCPA